VSDQAQEFSREKAFTSALTADAMLAMFVQLAEANDPGACVRTGSHVETHEPVHWETVIDGERVPLELPATLTIQAADDNLGGCVVTIKVRVDSSSLPEGDREQLAQEFPGLVARMAALLEETFGAAAQPGRMPDFTCVYECRVANTVAEVTGAILEMQQGSAAPESAVPGAVSIDVPFEWDVPSGDATIRGVSPGALTLAAKREEWGATLEVRYEVKLENVPSDGRDQVKDVVMATVNGSGPIWAEAIASSAASTGSRSEPPWVRWRH
jgi:hypothetical protein